MNIVHFNETKLVESHFSFSLSLSVSKKKNLEKTANGASVLGKPSSATTTAAAAAPKRRRNATRRPQGQLRAIVGDHRREAVGPTSRGGGSGPGLLHRSEDPKSTRVPNPPGLRVPFRPLRRDRISSRLCSLCPSRWSQQPHRRQRLHRSLQTQGLFCLFTFLPFLYIYSFHLIFWLYGHVFLF